MQQLIEKVQQIQTPLLEKFHAECFKLMKHSDTRTLNQNVIKTAMQLIFTEDLIVNYDYDKLLSTLIYEAHKLRAYRKGKSMTENDIMTAILLVFKSALIEQISNM